MVRIEVEIAIIYCPPTYFGDPQFFTEYIVRRDATTVGELKAVIEQDHSQHIPAHQQILRNASMQLLLYDDESLDASAVLSEEAVREQYYLFRRIHPHQVQIRVTIDPAQMHLYPELHNDREMEFMVYTLDLVSDIKRAIDAKIGIPPGRQRLMFLGRELRDDLHLDAFITNMDDLVLNMSEMPRDPEFTIEIPLQLVTGSFVHVAVELHDTVNTLRGIILRSGYLVRPRQNYSLYQIGNYEDELDGDMTFDELGDATILIAEYIPKDRAGRGNTVVVEEEGGAA